MTITELIAKLEAARAEHGDLRVKTIACGGGGPYSVNAEGVSVHKAYQWEEHANPLGKYVSIDE